MFQHTGQELADNLKECMARALRRYHDINKTLPGRIVVYRDGVGDGQVRDGRREGGRAIVTGLLLMVAQWLP